MKAPRECNTMHLLVQSTGTYDGSSGEVKHTEMDVGVKTKELSIVTTY